MKRERIKMCKINEVRQEDDRELLELKLENDCEAVKLCDFCTEYFDGVNGYYVQEGSGNVFCCETCIIEGDEDINLSNVDEAFENEEYFWTCDNETVIDEDYYNREKAVV